MAPTVIPPDSREYYAPYVDWNSFVPVAEHINSLISGDPKIDWFDWLARTRPPFARTLSLNCGNGMVEQALFNWGVVQQVVGVDVSEASLADAREEAAVLGLPAEYVSIDVNRDALPAGPFDLVLNHAALHHVAALDRVVRGMREVVADDGLLVHFDYTGPHRNQYDTEAWALVVELNASLPAELRNDALCYPHLPTMLVQDPTEAVHSELILETLDRYFDVERLVPLGGAIAYPLLHQHDALHARQATPEGEQTLRRIVEMDAGYTSGDPARSLFTFALMRPRPGALDDHETLARWTAEELEREERAANDGDEYYRPTAFGLVYRQLADEQMRYRHLAATQHVVHQSLDRLRDPRRVAAAVRRRAGRLLRGLRRRLRRG